MPHKTEPVEHRDTAGTVYGLATGRLSSYRTRTRHTRWSYTAVSPIPVINPILDLYGSFCVSIYAFTILSDKSHIIFSLLIFNQKSYTDSFLPLLQTTPQLPGTLPITTPPELYPMKHRDAAESSGVTLVFQRWLQTRFRKINKNQVSQPPDQLFTESGRPVNLFNSQSQVTANITKKALSRMAGATHEAVGIFFFGRPGVWYV